MARITTRIETVRGKLVLVPANQHSADELRDVHRVAKSKLHTTVLRYTEHDWLRDFYWGVLEEVADGLGVHKDYLHVLLKDKVGLIKDKIPGRTGPITVLKSIANKSNGGDLSPSDRRKYINDAIETIFVHYVDASERPALFKRVEERIGQKRR